GVTILEAGQRHRIGFISFYVEGIHHNLIVRLLNDRYGIQTRGGCSCAGTYGHILLNIDYEESHKITELIDLGDMSKKPGWVRISLHPTMTDSEVNYIAAAVEEVIKNHSEWGKDYRFDKHSGDFEFLKGEPFTIDIKKSLRLGEN
ncbi:MAG: aminotransferase class V-fold PLP-dependent enzyme, partial [Calditrichia bacterium]